MEKTESRVKRFIVTDLEEFEENLVKCLIMGGISYVQIEDEFHFLDNIYRFYDSKKLKEIGFYSSFDTDGIIRIISPFDILCTEDVLFDDRKVTDFKPIVEDISDNFDQKIQRK